MQYGTCDVVVEPAANIGPPSLHGPHSVDYLEKHQEEDQYYYIQYICRIIIVLPKIHISVLLPSVDHTHKADYLEKHQDDHEEEE